MPLAERVDGKDEIKTDSELVKLQEWLDEAERAEGEQEYRTISVEDYRFYSGKQDTPEVEQKLIAAKRPVTVFNEVKPKIDMLVGMAAQAPFSPNLIPVGVEDEARTELAQGTLYHYRRKLKIADLELSCFEHTAKTGRSLLYFHIDRSNPFKPKIVAERIHGSMFWVDPDSVEYDLSDARYVFLDRWLTKEEIAGYWPDYPFEDIKSLSQSAVHVPSYYNVGMDKYRLVEVWYRKWVPVRWFINPLTGEPENLEKDEFAKFVKVLAEGVPNPQNPEEIIHPTIDEVYESRIQKIFYSVFSGTSQFEAGQSPYRMEFFPCVLYGAYKDDDINSWFGAITMMKDPQRSINTMRRQLSHLLQTLPKGILMHEVGAILNIDEYEEKSSEPTYHMELAKGYIDKVKFEKQPSISPIYRQYDDISRQSMRDASGIPTEMMGNQTTSREPGITVRTRLEAGSVVLYILFNNFRRSRILGSKILMYLIQQYVNEAETIRINGMKGAQLMQINTQMNPQAPGFNDISAMEYDLEFDEIMETNSMRAATALMLNDFAHQQPGSVPVDVILEFTNIPFTVKNRLREYWEEQRRQEQENIEADRAVEMAKVLGNLRGKQIGAESKNKEKKEASK